MNLREETYKVGSIIMFFFFILTGWKYLEVKRAYQEAETVKVKFCKENVELRQKIDTLEKENFVLIMDNSRYQDFIQSQGY